MKKWLWLLVTVFLLTAMTACHRLQTADPASAHPEPAETQAVEAAEEAPADNAAGGTMMPDESDEPAADGEPDDPAGKPESSEGEAESEPQDGDRSEDTIMLEGMEETVRYEHIRNEAAGFELDYDCESLERYSGSDSERFVSIYDDPGDPWNYLEVRYDTGNAELVAAAVSATLSGRYGSVDTESAALDRAGSCLRIEASGDMDGTAPDGSLQTVYIIPAGGGCLVAEAHYTYESAEGFGRRFDYIMNTLALIGGDADGDGERMLSDEQALSAIRNYCYAGNPELEGIEDDGEYPVYWEVSSSDEHEIVVLFRSYTGAEIRYYIDPASGATHVTEFVPGVSSEEEPTDESLNAWDYLYE